MKKDIEYFMNLPYNFVVKKDEGNKGEVCYIARVLEIPYILGDGATAQEALETLSIHLRMAIGSYLEDGLPIPEPQTKYSGNINIRVDPELHARLALEAAAYNMSLNKYTALILERRKTPPTEQPVLARERKPHYTTKKK
jgi:predicted HicB family RNase H-like nuclease